MPQNYRLLSGFGRINYSYDDKYLITGTFRADGSSKFRSGNRVGYFPGISAAWRISREEFMKSVTAVSDLKLRLSYGLAGNNRIRDFLFSQNFSVGSIPDPNNPNSTTPIPDSLPASTSLTPGPWKTGHSCASTT